MEHPARVVSLPEQDRDVGRGNDITGLERLAVPAHRFVHAPKRAQALVMKVAQIDHASAPAERGAGAEAVESGPQITDVPSLVRRLFDRFRGHTRGIVVRIAWEWLHDLTVQP
jgi:hypothetical protein